MKRTRWLGHIAMAGLFGLVASAAPASVAAASPSPVPSIAYVGCSNTWMTVDGYESTGGVDFWPPIREYGGGTVDLWASTLDGDVWWTAFDAALANHGSPAAIWLEICAKGVPYPTAQMYADTVAVIKRLHSRTHAPVYVSGINGYKSEVMTDVHWVEAAQTARDVVRDGFALAGPVLPFLGLSKVRVDKTHPNPNGRLLLGDGLFQFFG